MKMKMIDWFKCLNVDLGTSKRRANYPYPSQGLHLPIAKPLWKVRKASRQQAERVDKAERVAKLKAAYERLADAEISPFDEGHCVVDINHSAFHRSVERLANKIHLERPELPE